MSYQSDIYAAIIASATLSEAIGGNFSWEVADGSTPAPYIVAQTISDDGGGDLAGDRSLTFPLVQFTCWAVSKEQAIDIMRTFKAEIEGRNLTGDSNPSLGYAGQQSTRDPQTKLFGEIREYKVSANLT